MGIVESAGIMPPYFQVLNARSDARLPLFATTNGEPVGLYTAMLKLIQ